MKSTVFKPIGKIVGVIGAIIAISALSWIITCGLIKLITLCFGLTFSWSTATGIWLVMALLRSVFKSNTTVKK